MAISITTFKARVAPKLHGTTLAKLSGAFYDKMYEASGSFRSKIKPHSLIRRARIENAIYDKIYNYTIESDVEADSIIDIRPIGERSSQDALRGSFSQEFDIRKENDSFAIEFINGAKTLRLSKELTARTVLHRADSLTLEGTVTLGGDASNASIDTLDYISGNGSIKFDLSGSTGQATITIALDTAIDLSDLLDLGALFEWLKFPTVSRLTSVQLKYGSSDSVYWHETATAAHDRSFTSAGDNAWMLLRHEWADASESGSPDEDDAEAIDYLQIVINYTAGAALSNVKLDNITAALGEAWETVYYSNRLFTDSTGATWKEIPTAETDLIQLDGADDNTAYLYEFMLSSLQEAKGKNNKDDLKFYRDQLGDKDRDTGLYGRLSRKYPDQSVIRQTVYYDFDDLDGR